MQPCVPPHWPDTPLPPHVPGGVQSPQPFGIRFPQPSPAGPHVRFWSAQLFGWHEPVGGEPHLFCVPPPPHVCPCGHLPQPLGIKFPQPSPAAPQSKP